MRASMEKGYGLDKPFLLRCVRWLGDALAFNMGDIGGSVSVIDANVTGIFRELLLGRLPYTLALFGVSNFLFFFASLFTALYLYRKFEGFWDRLVVFLIPDFLHPLLVIWRFPGNCFRCIASLAAVPQEVEFWVGHLPSS